MIKKTDIPAIMAELNDYFIGKLLAGDFKTTYSSDNEPEYGNFVEVEMDDRFKFRFWVTKDNARPFDPYVIYLSMTAEQEQKAREILSEAHVKYLREELLRKREEINAKLAKMDEKEKVA